MLAAVGKEWSGLRAVISGSGNVAIYGAEKAARLGARVIAMSDSCGYVLDEDGIDLGLMRQVKEVRRGRICEYTESRPSASYHAGGSDIWRIPCDVALPCATQNELGREGAEALAASGCQIVAEGANMPCTPDAVEVFRDKGIAFAPGKAANAGGVATSLFEMAQNSARISWTFDEVDNRLHRTMNHIYDQCTQAAADFGRPNDLVLGANAAGFIRVARAMVGQGVV